MNTFIQIKSLIERGIVPRKVQFSTPVDFAIDRGMYMGCPGMELFYSLSHFSSTEIESLACLCADLFPNNPPGRYVHLSVFWRYVFGVFIKQGLVPINTAENIRSKKVEQVQSTVNWDKYFVFSDMVYDLTSNFGKMLVSEMKAHRFGDWCIIHGEGLDRMLNQYERSYKISVDIGDKKNLFNSMFWCSRYLYEMEEYDLYKTYAARFFNEANKHCKSKGISSKFFFTCNALQSIDKDLFNRLAIFDNPLLNKLIMRYK